VYLRLVEDEIPVVVASVVDGVVRGVVELFDGGVEVVPPVLGDIEFDRNGSLDLDRDFTYEAEYYSPPGVRQPSPVGSMVACRLLPVLFRSLRSLR
jgi:hypothetical protein